MIDSKSKFEAFLKERFPGAEHADDKEWREQMELAFVEGVDWACDKIEDGRTHIHNSASDEMPLRSPCYWCTNCTSDECARCGPEATWRHYRT